MMIRLTQMRLERGWSKAELARRSGLDQSLIGKYESGRMVPYYRELRRISDAFGMPPENANGLLEKATHLPTPGEISAVTPEDP